MSTCLCIKTWVNVVYGPHTLKNLYVLLFGHNQDSIKEIGNSHVFRLQWLVGDIFMRFWYKCQVKCCQVATQYFFLFMWKWKLKEGLMNPWCLEALLLNNIQRMASWMGGWIKNSISHKAYRENILILLKKWVTRRWCPSYKEQDPFFKCF